MSQEDPGRGHLPSQRKWFNPKSKWNLTHYGINNGGDQSHNGNLDGQNL